MSGRSPKDKHAKSVKEPGNPAAQDSRPWRLPRVQPGVGQVFQGSGGSAHPSATRTGDPARPSQQPQGKGDLSRSCDDPEGAPRPPGLRPKEGGEMQMTSAARLPIGRAASPAGAETRVREKREERGPRAAAPRRRPRKGGDRDARSGWELTSMSR